MLVKSVNKESRLVLTFLQEMALTTNSRHTQRKVLSTHIKISTYFSDKIVMSALVIACLRDYHLQNNSRDKFTGIVRSCVLLFNRWGWGFSTGGSRPPSGAGAKSWFSSGHEALYGNITYLLLCLITYVYHREILSLDRALRNLIFRTTR